MRDPYLYEDVDILINSGDIRDTDLLKQAEADITKFTMAALYEAEFSKYDTQTIQEIHKLIFGDLYPWAGEFRTIQITKPEHVLGGDTVRYSFPGEIKKELDSASKEIARLKKDAKDTDDLIFRLARITAKIWQTHPFREGNTRAVISFSVLLAMSLGLEVDYSLFEKHAAYVRNSLVWASQGMYSKFEYLERIYCDAIAPKENSPDNTPSSHEEKYSMVNGYYVADLKELPHEYSDDTSTEE